MLWDKCLPLAMETMDPPKLGFPRVSHAGEGASWGGEGLVLWKEISHKSDNLSYHLAGQTRTNSDGSMMDPKKLKLPPGTHA